jgi:hypothetical protein
VLRTGTIPRRSAPFDRESLAQVSACGLLDPGELTRVLGTGLNKPEIGFGDWHCGWTSTTSKLLVTVFFDQNQWTTQPPAGARHTTIGGRNADIIPQPEKCGVWVDEGYAAVKPVRELLRIEIHGPQPMDQQLCGPAEELAAAAVARLRR